MGAVCLVVSVTADDYAGWQRWLEVREQYPYVDCIPPPLVDGSWLGRLPLFFGVACLAYVILEAAWWTVRTAIGYMTSNWQRDDETDDR